MTISAYQSLASVFIFLPFLVPEIGLWSIRDLADISVLANLIFLGAFCSALAYLLYIRAVKNLGATVSSAFLNLIPVVTWSLATCCCTRELLPCRSWEWR
jgi:drug/metabolite transporter (DMT)-like permease